MKELVIINLAMKGYSKATDVHYALSENELLIEIKDQNQKVHRLCKTLNKEIDVNQSTIEMLVDFIAVKLKKADKEVAWDQLGYDIKDFSLPLRGQMKSNFITYTVPKPEPVAKSAEEQSPSHAVENGDDKENKDSSNQATEETEMKPDRKVNPELPRHNRQLCFLNLESSQIFKIY